MSDVTLSKAGSDVLQLLEAEREYAESVIDFAKGGVDMDVTSLFMPLDTSIDRVVCYNNDAIKLNRQQHAKKIADILECREVTNTIAYRPCSPMGWHTNSNAKGKRIYAIYNYGDAVFRYLDPDTNEVVDSIEPSGIWLLRSFEIPQNGFLWHTIASNNYRLAYGFYV